MLPASLSKEAQRVTQRTGISLTETIEESCRLGFPIFREGLVPDTRTNLKPCNIYIASRATGLDVQAIEWRCVELGLPLLVEQLCVAPLAGLRPLSWNESRRCFKIPRPEFDVVAAFCASLPVLIPEYESLGHF